MNGYELVRLQAQQVKKTGDTISGNLSATSTAKFVGNLQGNSDTATRLQTARAINGTSFNGTANITTASWGTSRNIQIGNSIKAINGSANVSYTLADIGAVSFDYTTNSSDISGKNFPRIYVTGKEWLRTPSGGIVPYAPNQSRLGTSDRPFYDICTQYFNGRPNRGAGGRYWDVGVDVGQDGVTELGKYLDLHESNATHSDYDLRLTANNRALECSGSIKINGSCIPMGDTVPNFDLGKNDNRWNTTYTKVIDLGGTIGIYPLGDYTLTFKCGRQQGGEAAEIFYGHNGTTYHFEPKWSGDVVLSESTGLGRGNRKWRDVWSHAGSLQTSDITMKENVKKVVSENDAIIARSQSDETVSNISSNSILTAVKSLQPITFDYKGTRGSMRTSEANEYAQVGRQLGISAQELEKINPALFEYIGVKTEIENEAGEKVKSYSIKTLAYSNMILVALQEAIKRIESLESEVNKLKQI